MSRMVNSQAARRSIKSPTTVEDLTLLSNSRIESGKTSLGEPIDEGGDEAAPIFVEDLVDADTAEAECSCQCKPIAVPRLRPITVPDLRVVAMYAP